MDSEKDSMKQTILVAGAAGYIGSHICLELLLSGQEVVALDNYSNSKPEALCRVERLAGRKFQAIYAEDVRNRSALRRLFERLPVDSVIQCAAHKAVAESVREPLKYYENNVGGMLSLLEEMQAANVKRMVFSSSATVYADFSVRCLSENQALGAVNPYGRTKRMMEEILTDLTVADPNWRVVLLRYFNPVGAHESGEIGEDPKGVPNNLMPFVAQVAAGRQSEVLVFGNDYPTPDGTGLRDYIHVVDLAKGHVKALAALDSFKKPVTAINLGSGRGHSVLELLQAFSKACGKAIPYRIVSRRPGDEAAYWADPSAAKQLLNWEAEKDLMSMCEDVWRWQSKNPLGYPD